MVTHNLSKLVPEIVWCKTSFEQSRGLLFRKKTCCVFEFPVERKAPIHMIGVFYPIDVFWLDSNMRVVDMKKRVLPFTPIVYHKGKAKYIVEFPTGTSHKISLMDTINIK